MSQSLSIVLLLLTCPAFSAQNEAHPIRNIVLVHGAWADGSGWKGVHDILVKMWLPRSAFLLNKMDRAFLLLTAMGEP